jgi:hypothetical protein
MPGRFLSRRATGGFDMRTSEYLASKIRNLLGSIKFFQRRKFSMLVFLRQIEFWNWELDELIFSVNNFKERRQVWMKEPADLISELEFEGYCLSEKETLLRNLRSGQKLSKEYVVPVDELNEVIREWNTLLAQVENQLFDRKRITNIRSSNGVAIGSLDRYRKKSLESPD